MCVSKRKISISLISPARFYTGILSGFLFGVSLFLFFKYSAVSVQYITSTLHGYHSFKWDTINAYTINLAFFSSICGFSVCTAIWFQNNCNMTRQERLKILSLSAISSMLMWSMILVIYRFGTFTGLYLHFIYSPIDYLDLNRGLFLLLFPLFSLVLFIQCWSAIRLAFSCTKWIFLSIVFCFGISIFLLFCF